MKDTHMRRLSGILWFLLVGSAISFAQEKTVIPRQILTSAGQMPEFPGGNDALKTYLAKSVRYPKSAYKKGIQGRVLARFIVEPDGSVSDPEIISSLSEDCDKETLRVIRKMPRWHPARQNNAFVAVYYTLPITFSLE
ncbi:energy transducer TonB [Taibaiella koreensis]|uniref:energy transducer TonB n=1 Tax=Taibaiella koreensis TaxID=1268548 RepID=UPI000E59C4A2|nr:energy transducer TonB [Taibaiella koreensis]